MEICAAPGDSLPVTAHFMFTPKIIGEARPGIAITCKVNSDPKINDLPLNCDPKPLLRWSIEAFIAGLDINIFLLSRSSLAASGGKFLPLRPRKRSQRQYQQHILCECPLVTAARPVAAETVKPFRVKPPGLQPATRPSHGRLSTNPNPTPIRRTKLL